MATKCIKRDLVCDFRNPDGKCIWRLKPCFSGQAEAPKSATPLGQVDLLVSLPEKVFASMIINLTIKDAMPDTLWNDIRPLMTDNVKKIIKGVADHFETVAS